jgi:hypothetical protein
VISEGFGKLRAPFFFRRLPIMPKVLGIDFS